MGGEQAAGVLTTVKQDAGANMSESEVAAFQKPILDKYEREGSAYYSSARLWDDGVIDPVDTRKVLAHGLSAASVSGEGEEAPFGIFRM